MHSVINKVGSAKLFTAAQAAYFNQELFMDNQETLVTTAEHLGKDLLGFILQEIKALPDVWQRLPEKKQRDVIDRARDHVQQAIAQAVHIIFSDGKISVVADLDGVAIKDEIKATFKVSRANNADHLNALYESHNQPCLIVLADVQQFTGGMHEVKAEPDQKGLNLA